MIVDLDYKGPKRQGRLKGQFRLEDLKRYLKSKERKPQLRSAEGKELSKDDQKRLQQLRRQSFRFVDEQGRGKTMKAAKVAELVEEMEPSEELEVSTPKGTHQLRMQNRLSESGLPALRREASGYIGRRGAPDRGRVSGASDRGGRGRVGVRYPGDPGRSRYRLGGGIPYNNEHPYESFPAFMGGIGYNNYNNAYPYTMPVVSGRDRGSNIGGYWRGRSIGRSDYMQPWRRRYGIGGVGSRYGRTTGARWPGDPGMARYRLGGGIPYNNEHPYESFPAFMGGIGYNNYNNAYPYTMPVVNGRDRYSRRYGAAAGSRYGATGGSRFGTLGGRRFGRFGTTAGRTVGARWPGDPGMARYRLGGGLPYNNEHPYESFPAIMGGIGYNNYNNAYPMAVPVVNGRSRYSRGIGSRGVGSRYGIGSRYGSGSRYGRRSIGSNYYW